MRRSPIPAALLALSCLQAGCSILSPNPLVELLKATGTAASGAISIGPSSAKNVVYHPHKPIYKLCIEFNPQSQAADMVPSLQAELQAHMIESRVTRRAAIRICARSGSTTWHTSNGISRPSATITGRF